MTLALMMLLLGQDLQWGGNPKRVYDVSVFSVRAPQYEGGAYLWIAHSPGLEISSDGRDAKITGPNGVHRIRLWIVYPVFEEKEIGGESVKLFIRNEQKELLGTFEFAYEDTKPPPDDDDDDDDDGEVPDNAYGLRVLVRGQVAKLSSGARAKATGTANNYRAAFARINNGDYKSVPLRDAIATINSSLRRDNNAVWGSYRGEWADGFGRPVETRLNAAWSQDKIKTIDDFGAAILAIIRGLED